MGVHPRREADIQRTRDHREIMRMPGVRVRETADLTGAHPVRPHLGVTNGPMGQSPDGMASTRRTPGVMDRATGMTAIGKLKRSLSGVEMLVTRQTGSEGNLALHIAPTMIGVITAGVTTTTIAASAVTSATSGPADSGASGRPRGSGLRLRASGCWEQELTRHKNLVR
jgi:hypothetical protein